MINTLGKIRWLNVILFFSLALNFFIAGYLVSDTKVFNSLHSKRVMHKRPEIRVVDYFPQAEKREFRQRIIAHREKIKPIKKAIFKSQKEIFDIISERKINEQKLRGVFRKYQLANDQLQTDLNDIVVDMILNMDYKTRLKIIKRGKKAHQRRMQMSDHLKGRRDPSSQPVDSR